ncbi:MAG: c-type cytochrome [Acidobacteria bacterium]|nr:MAG: c-type cytochrome [Acidobacteriota bacterium]
MTRRSAPGGLGIVMLFSCIFGLLAGTSLGSRQKAPDAPVTLSVFRRAPASAFRLQNPYAGRPEAALAGRKLFLRHCAQCHGENAEGRGNAPPLRSELILETPDGVLFWFLKNGNLRAGMPSWSGLPPEQRWQIVSFLKTLR